MSQLRNREASGSGWGPLSFCLFCVVALQSADAAPRYFTYVGALSDHSVLLAWGTTEGGGNTIGRNSPSHGSAVVEVAGKRVEESQRNWVEVSGLKSDSEYPYKVSVDGSVVGEGRFRTWATQADRLCFFVIGDYGTGTPVQRQVALMMSAEFSRRAKTENPVRFVLTTGDNIYGSLNLFLRFRHTGAVDSDWTGKFFEPYETLIKSVPFYATLGNHDGNETEVQADLATYLDNFFFPENGPHRYYRFVYGGLAEFFALDSTKNTMSGGARPQYTAGGEQEQWLRQRMPGPAATPWRIAYFHHPPFTAGPLHGANRQALRPILQALQRGGVQVVFNGHEHNFQYSTVDAETGGIQYVVSGAGGELRTGNVTGNMKAAHIAGWSAQHHFLVVEIEGKTMRITPLSFEPVTVKDAAGRTVSTPLVVKTR